MRRSKKPVVRFLLIAALTFGATWFLLPRSEAEFPHPFGVPGVGTYDWALTPPAQARTAAGDCDGNPDGAVCLEECFVYQDTGEMFPTGNFACFSF